MELQPVIKMKWSQTLPQLKVGDTTVGYGAEEKNRAIHAIQNYQKLMKQEVRYSLINDKLSWINGECKFTITRIK